MASPTRACQGGLPNPGLAPHRMGLTFRLIDCPALEYRANPLPIWKSTYLEAVKGPKLGGMFTLCDGEGKPIPLYRQGHWSVLGGTAARAAEGEESK